MDDKLGKLLDMLVLGLEKGAGLLQEELPKLAHEILEYNFYTNLLSAIVFVFIGIVIVVAVIYALRNLCDDGFDYGFTGLIGSLFITVVLGTAVVKINNIIKIKVAPRVYIIDYIRTIR